MKAKILSAHELRSGLVVYLTSEGDWSRKLEQAAPALDERDEERLLQISGHAVGDNDVIEVAFIDVDWQAAGPVPVRLRERIRAGGSPTFTPQIFAIAAE